MILNEFDIGVSLFGSAQRYGHGGNPQLVKVSLLELILYTLVWFLVWKGWHTSHPGLVVDLQVPKGIEGSMATIQWAHRITFVAMVSLLIKLVIVLLRSCGRATFCIVVWLGFNTVANSISASSLNTDLVYY